MCQKGLVHLRFNDFSVNIDFDLSAVNILQDAKLSQVVNSIRVVGLALQTMYNDRCRDNTTICTEMLANNGTLLYQYLINVTFIDQFQQEMYFDANGDPPAWQSLNISYSSYLKFVCYQINKQFGVDSGYSKYQIP